LKTLEKINRKGNRNSRKIEKANSAQVGPFSPARAPTTVSNLSPTISPPWTHPRPRVLRPRPSPRALLTHLPSLICALCLALSPCLREPRAPPPPADAHRLFRGRRCARAPSSATVSFTLPSATRDTLWCALSLPVVPGQHSPEHFLAQPESATVAPSSPCAFIVASRCQRFCSR
jgi:hypothetical protein